MRIRRLIGVPALLTIAPLAGCGAPPPTTAAAVPVAVASEAPFPAPPLSSASAPSKISEAPSLGQLDFTVSGNADCQQHFREGMLALHSFEYDQAHESFGAALAADPHCAMAAWGDAMAYDHPVWHERDLTKGRAALAQVTREDALTAKERSYLGAARASYAKDSPKDAHAAWLAAAAAMDRDYPGDDEVTLQHALALITVYGYEPSHVREQMEAGALALGVLARRPEHPGAAHYAIHAFDSREHAILALSAARTYARIAPAAGHALHMPSHTFTHLGMWRDVVPSNERAYAASAAWEKAHGHTPSKYDWHSYSWLIAAHLELGQPSAARKLVDEASALLVAARDDSGPLRGSYSNMISDYVSQTERWGDVEALAAPELAPALGEGTGGDGPVACAMHAPGAGGEVRAPIALIARLNVAVLRAEAAIRQGDEATAVARVADLKAVRSQMAPWAKTLSPRFAPWWDATAEQLLARAHAGSKPSVAAQKRVIAALEKIEQLDKESPSAGPAWERTTRELHGEALFAAGKPKEALAQYEIDLDARPNRALALLGAARAAKGAGDAEKARGYYATLADLWKDADGDLPALAEVRDGAR